MSRPMFIVATLLALASTVHAGPPAGQPLLIELPPEVLAQDVGADGFVIAGGLYSGGGITWMPTAGVQGLGGIAARSISRDGRVLAGTAFDANGKQNAAYWPEGARTPRLLGSFTPDAQSCDTNLSSTFGMSDDGRVVVGLGWNGCKRARAFRWEESTGMVDLGSTVEGRSSRANNVSGDGRIVVGWQEHPTGFRMGAKWVNGVQELIQGPGGGFVGEAFAVNRDGSVIAGTNCQPEVVDPVPAGWVWTAEHGVTCLPVPKPAWLIDRAYSVLPETVSDDGRVIAGAYSFGLDSEAVVWFDETPYFLRDYLRSVGLTDAFRDWVNTGFLLGSTRDGRVLVGYGAGPTTFTGYMVVLPEVP